MQSVTLGTPVDGDALLDQLEALRAWQAATGVVRACAPLPVETSPEQPTTGYDDMRHVALARLVLDNVEHIQAHWTRMGAKLSQSCLLFGANDIDAVPARDDMPHGPRRAILEEVRRNLDGRVARAGRARRRIPPARRGVIRIGAVGFLNARPLAYGLDRDPRVSLRLDLPSVCARLLHAGEIDLGLVPVIEMLRGPVTYDLVPGLAIACDGRRQLGGAVHARAGGAGPTRWRSTSVRAVRSGWCACSVAIIGASSPSSSTRRRTWRRCWTSPTRR